MFLPGINKGRVFPALYFVRALSSAERGSDGGRRSPPGHRASCKSPMALSTESSDKAFLKESRTFLKER